MDSLTSGTQMKSFWNRPEGKTGLVSLAIGGGLTLWGLYYLLPYLITIVQNVIYLGAMVIGIIAFGMFVTNGTVKTLASFMFKSVMRYITGCFIQIDPIGILKNFITKMKKQQELLKDKISQVSAARRELLDNINVNAATIGQAQAKAVEAKRKQVEAKDPTSQQLYALKIAENVQQASRLEKTNKELKALNQTLDYMYDMLIKWSNATQFYINDRENEVKERAMKYKAVNKAFGAMKAAKSILRGNADDNALYDQTLEFLAEDASSKLGEMEDFSRYANDFLIDVDLTNGAANHEALKKLEDMMPKLLPASAETQGFIDTVQSPDTKVFEPIAAKKTGYEDVI